MIIASLFGSVILCFLFVNGREMSFVAEEGIGVGVIDQDNSALSEDMLKYMQDVLKMKLTREEEYDALANALLDHDISVILEIPENMQEDMLQGKKRELSMTSMDDYANEIFTENYLETYMNRTAMLAEAAEGDAEEFARLLEQASHRELDIVVSDSTGPDKEIQKDRGGLEFVIGFSAMLVMSFTMYMGMLILEDKEHGTFRRMQAASISPGSYIAGQALCGFMTSVIFMVGLLGYLFITKRDIGMPFWLLILMCVLYVLFAVGFTLVLALLSKSKLVLMTIIVGFATITNILGGAWFPIMDSAGGLKKLSLLTPQYWMMETIRKLHEDISYNFMPALLVLCLFVLFTYLLAAVVYTRRET